MNELDATLARDLERAFHTPALDPDAGWADVLRRAATAPGAADARSPSRRRRRMRLALALALVLAIVLAGTALGGAAVHAGR
jgi:hypothetical protein